MMTRKLVAGDAGGSSCARAFLTWPDESPSSRPQRIYRVRQRAGRSSCPCSVPYPTRHDHGHHYQVAPTVLLLLLLFSLPTLWLARARIRSSSVQSESTSSALCVRCATILKVRLPLSGVHNAVLFARPRVIIIIIIVFTIRVIKIQKKKHLRRSFPSSFIISFRRFFLYRNID